ncbi:olfactory receptor 10C1-like [Pangshura tecta]
MSYSSEIAQRNHSMLTYFIFFRFWRHPETREILCVGFSIIYTITLTGNILIIFMTVLDPALHTLMNFFLRNLSFLEICYTSITIPKMLVNLISEERAISFTGCDAQMYFLLSLGPAECYLLAAIAYDRYRAICSPLHYTLLMNHRACGKMVAACWLCGILMPLDNMAWIFSGPNEVNHFFCDIYPVLKLACGDTSRNEASILAISVLINLSPFFLVVVSYARILSSILKTPSAEGRHKAFSTCSSHLTMVTLFYGSACAIYLRPKSDHSVEVDMLISLFYSVLAPVLNPMIYSLRNKEMKNALSRLRGRRSFS